MPVAWPTSSAGPVGCYDWFCLASIDSSSAPRRSLLRAAASRVAALQVAKQSKGKSGTSCAICRWSVYLLVCNRCFPSRDHLWAASLSQSVVAVMLGSEWYLTPAQSSVPAYKLALQFQKSPITQSFISSANNGKIRLHNIFDTGFRKRRGKLQGLDGIHVTPYPLRGVARSGCCTGRCNRRQICPVLDLLIISNSWRLPAILISLSAEMLVFSCCNSGYSCYPRTCLLPLRNVTNSWPRQLPVEVSSIV